MDDYKDLLRKLSKDLPSDQKKTVSSAIAAFIESQIRPSPAAAQESANKNQVRQDQHEITQISRILADSVATHLQQNTDWARHAIFKAQLGLPAGSIFGDRIRHFHDEKDLIARSFVSWLLKRIVHLLTDQGKTVYLILDSGTTMYWLFRELGPAIEKHASLKEIENLKIITNNLPGVTTYIEFGIRHKILRASDNAEVPLCDLVDCELLSGKVLARYAAVTGEKTEDALRAIRVKAGDDDTSVFIGLATGNWLSLNKNDEWPAPLARGAGHSEFKSTLMASSHEVYLVTPLGKLFVNQTLGNINNALQHETDDTEEEEYTQASVPQSGDTTIRVVSTARGENAILESHYNKVAGILGSPATEARDFSDYVTVPARSLPHFFFPFDKPSSMSRKDQIEMEFPHEYTRSEVFMTKYFSVKQPRA